jgi:F-type H+-transporting ATPase subunit delta
MAEKDALVRGYAEALFAVAEAEGELAAVEDQLYAFAKALETETKLREALTDPALPAENKKALIHDLLGDRANPHTVNVLGFLVDQGRAREIGRIVEEFAAVAEALSKATGRQVEIKVVVDPTVVGGVVAKVGDEVFDGSVRSRLDEARGRLTRSQ